MIPLMGPNFEVGIRQLSLSADAKKCWCCGCYQDALDPIEQAFADGSAPPDLAEVIATSRRVLTERKYDCIGCEECHPAVALGALQVDFNACASAPVSERDGWPPLPGDYSVLRFQAPVAVCTLTDETLAGELAENPPEGLSIVGTLQTENLGIERLITNVVANPHIRTLVLCGADSKKAVGHLPGQSLVALVENGIDDQMGIIGAQGNRPDLKNLTPETVSHFRRTIELVNLIGDRDLDEIINTVDRAVTLNLEPAESFHPSRTTDRLEGYLPSQMVADPAGYFVIYPDRNRGLVSLEHYSNEGVLTLIIEAKTAAETYTAAIEKGTVTRLDHAAYLGRELTRAERSLETGEPFVQDRAPERPKPPTDT